MKVSTIILLVFSALVTGLLGGALGLALAVTVNTMNSEQFQTFETALPTKILDINGEVITEFASDEKREIISLSALPQHMKDALLTREDNIFYSHHGFSVKAVLRAVIGQLTHHSLGGGSTLTQQIAGTLFCNRSDMSIKRKLKELWWAIQMERRYSKDEILELYLNKIYFGGGTYGVNAASKYYFGHGATAITPAEAAILVIQLSNPAYYNPFDYPNRAMERQRYVLSQMVLNKTLTPAQAFSSFDEFWANFDYTRTSAGSYYLRDDKAPWFSEYVRRELANLIYGSEDIYTGGFTVNTTLNLAIQNEAERVMQKYIKEGNDRYNREHNAKSDIALNTYVPLTELLALTCGIPQIKANEVRLKNGAMDEYLETINPIIDAASLVCGIDALKLSIVNKGNSETKRENERTTIEGTLICLQNETGYITALVGGSKFDSENQFIRATQAKLQPGSTFKPLYYSEAIDSRKFTASSVLSDTPVVFHTSDGRPYIPQNFKGEWLGDVPLFYALIHSMNVPSLKVLDGIGFDAAINRALSLLGISEEEVPSRGFNRVYPIGLGVCSVKPIELARAYSVIASGGHAITPICIRNVLDRRGNVILDVETAIRRADKKNQVMAADTTFVMTKIMEQTVQKGTLAMQAGKFIYRDNSGRRVTIPSAGKTGTTQNWADAWTSGFTPYYTATLWFGFDRPGQSLGLNITGSTLAGFAWGEFMREANRGLPRKEFPKPESGVIESEVCNTSGMLPTDSCKGHTSTQWYLEGTEPKEYCTLHGEQSASSLVLSRLQSELYKSGERGFNFGDGESDKPLNLNLDFLSDNEKTNYSDFDYFDEEGTFSVFDSKPTKKRAPTEPQENQIENKVDKSTLNYNYLMD